MTIYNWFAMLFYLFLKCRLIYWKRKKKNDNNINNTTDKWVNKKRKEKLKVKYVRAIFFLQYL